SLFPYTTLFRSGANVDAVDLEVTVGESAPHFVTFDLVVLAARQPESAHGRRRDLADRDGLSEVSADLEDGSGERSVEHLESIELRLRRDAIDLGDALLHLGVERRAVRWAVRRVARLHGELADTLQVVRDLLQRALGDLRERDAVVRVPNRLIHTADLRREPLRDRESRRIVLRAVDAQARRQTGERRSE